MHVPPAFREDDPDTLRSMIRDARLSNLVTATAGGLMSTPLPLFLDPDEGEHDTLYGHLAGRGTTRGPMLCCISNLNRVGAPHQILAKIPLARPPQAVKERDVHYLRSQRIDFIQAEKAAVIGCRG